MIIDYQPQLKNKLIMARIIWSQFMITLPLYWFIARMAYANRTALDEGLISNIRLIFIILSLLSVSVIAYVKKTLDKDASNLKQLKEPELSLEKLQSASIVSCALAEVPAILGLVLALLSKDMNNFLILAGISVLALLYHFPKIEVWERTLKDKIYQR